MRNKKIKKEYHQKRSLLGKYDFYNAKHKKLPVSKEEYQNLKDEILILESRYPSIKKMGDDLIIRAELTYGDGRAYSGAIKSAKEQIPHGHGFMSLHKDELDWTYVGDFKDGVFDGQGEFISKGYYSYKGEWEKSHFNGKGKHINEKSNEVYEGEFVNDKRNGYGILIASGEYKYEGQWKDNDAHGKGKLTFFKDSEQHEKGKIMEGNFKNGSWNGIFKITFSDGVVMKVKYKMGKYVEKVK